MLRCIVQVCCCVLFAALLCKIVHADTARIVTDGPLSDNVSPGHVDTTLDTALGDSITEYVISSLPDGSPTLVEWWLNWPNYDSTTYFRSWEITFGTDAIPNTALVPGTYSDAERALFADSGHPGIDFIRADTGFNELFGSFTINQSTISNGQISSFEADFVFHEEDPNNPAITGQFYFNTVPEPSTFILAAFGLLGLIFTVRVCGRRAFI